MYLSTEAQEWQQYKETYVGGFVWTPNRSKAFFDLCRSAQLATILSPDIRFYIES